MGGLLKTHRTVKFMMKGGMVAGLDVASRLRYGDLMPLIGLGWRSPCLFCVFGAKW